MKQKYLIGLSLGLFLLAGIFFFAPLTAVAQIPIIGGAIAPKCFIETGSNTFVSANCDGTRLPFFGRELTPNFREIWKSFGGSDLRAGQCYRITQNQPGIEEKGFDSEECKRWQTTSTSNNSSGNNGGTGSSPGGTSPTSGTPATPGSAPTAQENEETPEEKLNIERKGGFEEVDENCNVGNQGRGCGITDRLSTIANVLSAGVGIVIVIVVIIGGIQYMTAGGDPQRVAAAKMRIINAMIALVAFFFLYSFLQWIVPGGIF